MQSYRLQLNHDFNFEHVRKLLHYFKALGVDTIYLSPVFEATKGSSHGYDIINPQQLSQSLGGEAEWHRLLEEISASGGVRLLLDIVPNHLAASPENKWWWDVLENGPSSPFAEIFDVFWELEKGSEQQVVLPVLGRPLSEALEQKEISLKLEDGLPVISYYDRTFPLNSKSLLVLLDEFWNSLCAELGKGHPQLHMWSNLRAGFSEVPEVAAAKNKSRRYKTDQELRIRFRELGLEEPARSLIADSLDRWNKEKGHRHLQQLLEQQAYRLEYWRLGLDHLNYRRFFDISDLIGVRVEDETVFNESHKLIFDLAKSREVVGLRIDHIDGLLRPMDYLNKLRTALKETRPEVSLYVEKILSGDEKVPSEWPIEGTTGYEYQRRLNNIFISQTGFAEIERFYRELCHQDQSSEELLVSTKKQVVKDLFHTEFHQLGLLLKRVDRELMAEGLEVGDLVQALEAITVNMSVYRTYGGRSPFSSIDQQYIQQALERAESDSSIKASALNWWRRIFLSVDKSRYPAVVDLIERWQQVSGAVMAKGYEDTYLYRYFPLASLNEVGSELAVSKHADKEMHEYSAEIQKHFPMTMNCTSTHDTKRGEDVRARLNVLSWVPNLWCDQVRSWVRQCQSFKTTVGSESWPDSNAEYLIFQSLVGIWQPQIRKSPEPFRIRLRDSMIKASKEAKLYTSWLDPNHKYETALAEFVDKLFSNEEALDSIEGFAEAVSYWGAFNSLGQVVAKIMAPGCPDFYQGTELYDFTLVDPDNRRPVDYQTRILNLDSLTPLVSGEPSPEKVTKLIDTYQDGQLKQYVTARLLHFRRENPWLIHASYEPIFDSDKSCFSFLRRLEGKSLLVIIGRSLTNEEDFAKKYYDSKVFTGKITMPHDGEWEDLLSGHVQRGSMLDLEAALRRLPVSVYFSES